MGTNGWTDELLDRMRIAGDPIGDAYIRTHAAKPPAKSQDVPADIHATLTVLATHDTTRDGSSLLDLHAAELPNLNLLVS
ncbi:hypothetical protein PUR49_00440 [Streptomyces sp. BE147]|uniref:hypothetical protein n=1 Tax=Streptomyces sp. BE147 TaxID=3002524 RepID=UPI002E795056|nr:hypothetical protein [Streptomyces sp. BE147]MEE1735040.1 hypothetical protein [Streptomyces sp. BE147]